MKTAIILAHIDNGNNGVIPGTGWSLADALSATAACMLDQNRFGEPSFVDDVLARHGDESRAPLYPASDVLEAAGVDLAALNNAAANGLDMRVFGQAVNAGLDLADVNDLLDRYDGDGDNLTGMLANFVEASAAQTACPDAATRAYRHAIRRAA